MTDQILGVLQSIRIQDVFDVAIIAGMIFVLLTWFKDRASRFVLVGISLLGVVYLIARFFQLYLTTIALQGFFAILLFVLVVIFQEDLRRFFERLAVWGVFRKRKYDSSPRHAYVNIIADTVDSLSRRRTGALIVIQGHDPLGRHLTGGTELDGVISQPLLESIFDPHSAGHDGAVLILGHRITRFGCHLPLSIDSSRYPNVGLRHTAALGLAERSDAMCIVVSEERGSVSIARRERLHPVQSITELKSAIESFYEEKAPEAKQKFLTRWLKDNPREKIMAVLLACILWFFFGYQKESISRDFVVPIEYINVSKDWVIQESKTTRAKVVLTGSYQGFQLLNDESLKFSIDLSNLKNGWQEFILTKEMINVPSNLSVDTISPRYVQVRASRLISVSYPVDVITKNEPLKGLKVEQITVTPLTVKILLPANVQHKNIKIKTEPIDLKLMQTSTIIEPRILYPPEAQFPGGKPPSVKVYIKIEEAAANKNTND
ncbi:MAG: diadenylate cyclase [Deltaproteobacteria bacterium]|nr:diadenylate cyclase [Deltaproteobacteria bacterium]